MKDIIGQIRTVLLRAGGNQGVVVESYGGEALVAVDGAVRRLAANVAVAKGDTVTVREGRITGKRTTADRTYRV